MTRRPMHACSLLVNDKHLVCLLNSKKIGPSNASVKDSQRKFQAYVLNMVETASVTVLFSKWSKMERLAPMISTVLSHMNTLLMKLIKPTASNVARRTLKESILLQARIRYAGVTREVSKCKDPSDTKLKSTGELKE
jgi:hypothetical protein